MSPRSIISILVWIICVGALFAGIFAWGHYVEARDRVRLASTALTLQRGDLPRDYTIVPGAAEQHSILATIVTSTGATGFAEVTVTDIRQSSPTSYQVLYARYRNAGAAEDAVRIWRTWLGAPGTSKAAMASPGSRANVIAIWQRDTLVVVMQGKQAEGTLPALQQIAYATDKRLLGWLHRTPNGTDPFATPASR
ncbi:MAG: hypothetical protein ACYDBB_18665 [Armatimonadota bacterium]